MKRLFFSVAVLLGLSGCAVIHEPYYHSAPRVVTSVPIYVTRQPTIIYRYEYWHGHHSRYYRWYHRY